MARFQARQAKRKPDKFRNEWNFQQTIELKTKKRENKIKTPTQNYSAIKVFLIRDLKEKK